MEIYKVSDYNHISLLASDLIATQIKEKKDSVLGLATGSSPIGIYKHLIELYQAKALDFQYVSSVNLDEYCGLGPQDVQSYQYFMQQNLFQHININTNNTFIPNGLETDSKKACQDYDALIKKIGPIDLQLLGIGHNGHIGFNEPSDVFTTGTHCVKLSQTTLSANARFFENDSLVPKKAYTMGIKSIMNAKKIILIVSGIEKAEILKQAFLGPITPLVPASILQLHEQLTILGDDSALNQLEELL